MSVPGRLIDLAERGALPDAVLRAGIRYLLRRRLASLPSDCEALSDYYRGFLADLVKSPVALMTEAANEQHYEVPTAYFDRVLGPRKKYSSCYWGPETLTLTEAETNALRLTAEHAGLGPGQRILELGCGWGSLSLWMAESFPTASVTAVSNSRTQREFILQQAENRGCENLNVITADMNSFVPKGQFDRVVSVEMFEHMRNWPALLSRIAGWLTPDGRFLLHVFCHRQTPYFFEDRGDSDWMTRYFFAGGMMPSAQLPLYCQENLVCDNTWFWNGIHYARTLAA